MTINEQLHNSGAHGKGVDPSCPVCIERYVTATNPRAKARQRMEIAIVMAFVVNALAAGYTIVGNDNGEDELESPKAQNLASVLEIMFHTDTDRLRLAKGGLMHDWVCFMYGSDGWDVIHDYTPDLEPLMGGDVAALQERWGG
jgi:hypothetical protein